MNKKILRFFVFIIIIELIIFIAFLFITKPKGAVELVTNANTTCGLGNGCSISDKRVQGFNVGDQMPNVELKTINGKSVQLYDLLKGKEKFIISLSADWCTDCQRQDEKLNKYYKDLPEDYGAAVLFVDYSSSDGTKTTNKEQVKKFLSEKNYTFPTFWDENNIIAKEFGGVLATPTNIVLDKNAVIKAKTEEIDMDILFNKNSEQVNTKF